MNAKIYPVSIIYVFVWYSLTRCRMSPKIANLPIPVACEISQMSTVEPHFSSTSSHQCIRFPRFSYLPYFGLFANLHRNFMAWSLVCLVASYFPTTNAAVTLHLCWSRQVQFTHAYMRYVYIHRTPVGQYTLGPAWTLNAWLLWQHSLPLFPPPWFPELKAMHTKHLKAIAATRNPKYSWKHTKPVLVTNVCALILARSSNWTGKLNGVGNADVCVLFDCDQSLPFALASLQFPQ